MRSKEQRKRQAWGMPWFRNHDGWWYVTIDGKRHKLARGEENKAQAIEEWHRLMAETDAPKNLNENPLWLIFDQFLARVKRDIPDRLYLYRLLLQNFATFAGKDLPIKKLTVDLVHRWWEANPWADSSRNLATGILLSALNWAAKPEQGLIQRNPLKGMARPPIRSRGAESILDEDTFKRIIEVAPPRIKDALVFLRATGSRPGNLCRITKSAIDSDSRCVRLNQHKTARKTGRALIIPLTEVALEIVMRLSHQFPDGPIFRTVRGAPLTGKNLSAAFKDLKKKLKLPGNPILYGIRHTVATELLLADVPDAKVAFILGHANTSMLYHHYGHLDAGVKQIAEEMEKALNRCSAHATELPSENDDGILIGAKKKLCNDLLSEPTE